jgi:hypothetical protein
MSFLPTVGVIITRKGEERVGVGVEKGGTKK